MRKKRIPKKALTPIYIRLTRKKEKAEGRLDPQYDLTDVQVAKWDEIRQRLMGTNTFVNDHIDLLKGRLADYRIKQHFKHEEHSLKKIIEMVLHKEKSVGGQLLLNYVDTYYTEEIERSNSKAKGTKVNYLKAITHFKSFLTHNNIEKMEVTAFNYTLAEKFKKYMETEYPEIEKKKNTEVSASSNIKHLKPIFNKAIRENLIIENPFKGVKLKFDSPLAKVLSIEQVKALNDLNLSSKPSLQLAKDFFLFCCFTGLSYIDAIGIHKSELIKMLDGKIKIDTERNKTGKKVKQIVPKQAIEIVNKYTDSIQVANEGHVFPPQTGESINRSLKIIAAKANIPFDISTKTARITCSQLINEAGLENQLLIDSFMGWSSTGNIRRRYFHIKDTDLLDFSSRFEKYLDQNLYSMAIVAI